MKKICFYLILSVLLFSCSKKPLEVAPLDSGSKLDTRGLIYTVPRTVLSIKVEATKRVVIPGPFCKFALKYLGIADAPQQRVEEWRLTGIDVISGNEPDPSTLFVVSPGENIRIDFLKLSKSGLIIPINGIQTFSTPQNSLSKTVDEGVWFTDLSVDPFIGAQKTSFFSKVQQDTGFVKVPVQKEIIVEKNLEEKAREAAEFIFSIRKRRSEFLSVDADHNLNGEGLKIAFDELYRLENEYLSLFIGKSYSANSSHFFEYLPIDSKGETSIIFRFSTGKGVLSSADLSGNPILLKLEPEKVSDSYSQFFASISQEKDKPLNDVVYYRMPLNCNLRITDGKADIYQKRLTIYQYGPIVPMPARYIIKDNGFINSDK